jgi:HK97 family phage prohead protease
MGQIMQYKDAGRVIQHKSASFELKKEPDQDGEFEGYASVFGVVDQGMDVVERGAFAKSLGSGRRVKMLWQHDPNKVIGVWDEIKEDERGLYVKGRLIKDVALGREAMALMRAGAIDSMSIGYRTVEAVPEAGGRVRKLMEVDLFEVSVVTFPMNEAAMVTDVKNEDGRFDPKLMERALRDVFGLSISEAKAFMAEGFKALRAPRDVGASEAETEALRGLANAIRQLKEKTHV